MEPVTREIDTMYTTVESTNIIGQTWQYKLEAFPVLFNFPIHDHPNLKPGDRVRITITKEPADAQPR